MMLYYIFISYVAYFFFFFFFSSRRRHTRSDRDWSSDVCSSDLDVAVREPAQNDALGAAPAQESGRCGCERTRRVEVGFPVSAEDDHAAAAQALGEVAKQEDGLVIGPLQVVEHDQERLGALAAGQEFEDRAEQVLAQLVGWNLPRLGHSAQLLPEARH